MRAGAFAVMRPVVVIILAASLVGCASEAERQARQAERLERLAAADDAKCKGYGAQPGSPAYVQCRAQLDAARTQAIATAAAGFGATPGPPVYTPVFTPAPIIVPR